MKSIFQQILRLPALLASGLMALPGHTLAEEPAILIPVKEPAGWRIEWPTVEGQQYQLQRSRDLLSWENVFAVPVKATGGSLKFLDPAAAGQDRAYWRVIRLGISTVPLTVSPVVASFRSTQSGLRADLGVLTGGTEEVTRVEFLDGTRLLGAAVPGGNGDDWSFLLPGDLEQPQILDLRARATPAEGEAVATSPRRLLLADPSRFIPLGADGSRLYGEFIEVDASDRLGAFVFYPEGLGDADLTTGVHFEFPSGTELPFLNGVPAIQFSTARFFAGHEDPAPVSVSGSTRRLPQNGISPAVVRPLLGLPAEAPVPVRFGRTEMLWQTGSLGRQGWQALKVRGAEASFAVPDQQFNSTIVRDPEAKTAWLVDRYSGEWRPVPGGPVFRVPAADPLTFHHNREHLFFGSGTVEVEFPNGARARGSVALRNDIFEFRFEGRSITLPALAAVRRLLPTDPALCVPAGPATPGQLDLAAQCLVSFRDLFRSLASGGQEQSPVSPAAAPAPLPTPKDSAGATLSAWASRLASWGADRSGVSLVPPDLGQLSSAVGGAVRTGVAAHEPATPLKMIRDLLVLRRHAPGIIGNSTQATAFLDQLARAEDELFTAATRLITDRAELAPDGESAETAALLLEVDQAAGAVLVPAGGALPRRPRDAPANLSRNRARALAAAVEEKFPVLRQIAAASGNNAFFQDKTTGELLEMLARLQPLLNVLKAQGQGDRFSDAAPALMPFLQRLQAAFVSRHNADCLDGGIGFVRDYARLRARLADRARFFQLNNALGEPLDSALETFDPTTAGLLTNFTRAFREQPLAEAATTCSADLAHLSAILNHTTDNGSHSDLSLAQFQLRTCVDLLQNSNAAGDCDRLTPLFNKLGLPVMKGNPAFEGSQTIKATGQFESVPGFTTLQLSQGGRYLRGFLQVNAPGAPSWHHRIDGLLTAESSTAVEFAIVESDDDVTLDPDHVRRTGTLRVSLQDGQPVADLTTRAIGKLAGLQPASSNVRYRRTSPDPAWSRRIAAALTGEAREVFEAQQLAPLHSRQVVELNSLVQGVAGAVDTYLKSDNILAVRTAEVTNVNARIGGVLSAVGTQQIPVARQIFRQLLTRANITAEGVTLSAWNWLRVIFTRHAQDDFLLVQAFSAFMGSELNALTAGNAFRYKISISTLTEDSKNVTAFVIEKRAASAPDTSPPAATLRLVGAFFQGGIGPSASFGPSFGNSEIEVFSNIDYTGPSLSGPLMILGGTAGAGTFNILFNSFSFSAGAIFLYGNGTLPPLAVPLPTFSTGDFTLSVGAQLNFAAGFISTVNPGTPASEFSLVTEPLQQVFTGDAGSEGAAFFDLNLATLRPCGRFSLRELTAEYRAIFESVDSTVSILGFTDSSGGETFNATLSRQRAETVKQSLVAMIGAQHFKVPADRFRALGLGENPSRNLPAAGVTLTPEEAALVQRKRQLLGSPLPDGTKDQRWRSVNVLLNNLITVEISLPAKEVAP